MPLRKRIAPPDSTTPRRDIALLAGVGAIGLIQAVTLLPLSFLSSDFGPYCFWAVPGGLAVLVINLLVFSDGRRGYSRGDLSQPGSRYVAAEAIVMNGLPMALALVAFLAGTLLGPSNTQWVKAISPATLIASSMAMVFIFFPFNLLGVLVASVVLLRLRRGDHRPERLQAA